MVGKGECQWKLKRASLYSVILHLLNNVESIVIRVKSNKKKINQMHNFMTLQLKLKLNESNPTVSKLYCF